MTPFHIVSRLLISFFAASTSFAMLPLRSCRRSIASSPRWCRAQAHTVSLPGNSARHFRTSPHITSAPSRLKQLLPLSFSAFTDSTQKDLLKLIGNLPVRYGGKSELGRQERRDFSGFSVLMAASLSQGRSYNFPVLLWLLDSFPFTPPICFLRPTSNMVIREGKHVDARGRIFLPGLHNWDYVRFNSLFVWRKVLLHGI